MCRMGLGKGGECLCCWFQSHRKAKMSYSLELAKTREAEERLRYDGAENSGTAKW